MKRCFLLFILLPLIGAASFAQNASEKIDVIHYTFNIELNDSSDVIVGTTNITFSPKILTQDFQLDLINKNSDGKGMTVKSVTSGGKGLKFTHTKDVINISLSEVAKAGSTMTVSIQYEGVPNDGLIISKNMYGDRTFFADNWPNRGRNWLPIVDHPADKAQVEFAVVAPLHYEVVANGKRIEESFLNAKQKITRYKEDAPISTKVMVIGVARFAIEQSGVVDNVAVESWVYPQNRKEGFSDYALAVKVLEYFIKNIGPFSYEKLANVQSKTTFGGLENAGAIFYFEGSVNGKGDHELLIAHEIAHQWFGDSATETEWKHIWLSEGFATYFALLFAEHAYGVERRRQESTKDRNEVIQYYKKAQTPVVNPADVDPMELLNVNSYQKGGWVLHMLRQELGDEKFWNGIRAYYSKFQNKNASTMDFRQSIEKASGKDLSAFFKQWIDTPGHPVVEVAWKYDEGGKKLTLTVSQTQKGPLFIFPLEIGVEVSQGSVQIKKLEISKTVQEFSFPMAQKPLNLTLDPNVNLLFEGNLRN